VLRQPGLLLLFMMWGMQLMCGGAANPGVQIHRWHNSRGPHRDLTSRQWLHSSGLVIVLHRQQQQQ
jgi:hypothetical protein